MTHSRKSYKHILLVICLLMMLFMGVPSHASLLTGSDWNGMDFIPSNGDVLSGVFTNIRSFQINAGDIVSVGPRLDIFADAISIYGSLTGNEVSGSRLALSANTIYLGSSSSVTVPAGYLILESMRSFNCDGLIDIKGSQSIPTAPSIPAKGSVTINAGFRTIGSDIRFITYDTGSAEIIRFTSGNITNTPFANGSVTIRAGRDLTVGTGTIQFTGGNIITRGSGLITSGATLSDGGNISLAGPQTSAVPLPSTILLFGPAAAGFGFLRKKRMSYR